MTDFLISSLHSCRLCAVACVCKDLPVHSAMLSIHLFFGLHRLSFTSTVPCSITLVRSSASGLVTWRCPCHFSSRQFTVARRYSYSPTGVYLQLPGDIRTVLQVYIYSCQEIFVQSYRCISTVARRYSYSPTGVYLQLPGDIRTVLQVYIYSCQEIFVQSYRCIFTVARRYSYSPTDVYLQLPGDIRTVLQVYIYSCQEIFVQSYRCIFTVARRYPYSPTGVYLQLPGDIRTVLQEYIYSCQEIFVQSYRCIFTVARRYSYSPTGVSMLCDGFPNRTQQHKNLQYSRVCNLYEPCLLHFRILSHCRTTEWTVHTSHSNQYTPNHNTTLN